MQTQSTRSDRCAHHPLAEASINALGAYLTRLALDPHLPTMARVFHLGGAKALLDLQHGVGSAVAQRSQASLQAARTSLTVDAERDALCEVAQRLTAQLAELPGDFIANLREVAAEYIKGGELVEIVKLYDDAFALRESVRDNAAVSLHASSVPTGSAS